jgi:hypothetical protein
LIRVSLTVKVTLARVAVEVIAGVEVGLKVTVGAGVRVGSGALKLQAAKSMETSPVSRTRRFMISSFGNIRRPILAA